ncbi:MAG: hypothetical protein Q9170_006212, partial [Blastenia crenularia]
MQNEPGHEMSPINLFRGWPNAALLPTAKIKAASAAALSQPDVSIPGLLYGPDPGYEPLRHSITKFLTRFYQLKHNPNPQRICISGGASQNLASILQVFSDPLYTRNVWMVSPTYFKVCPIFEDNAFHGRLRSVPEDDEGIDVAFLEQKLQESNKEHSMKAYRTKTDEKKASSQEWRKIYRHIIYCVPTFANPTSRTMTLRRRQQLVKVARKHDALIISDDVYDQLQWPAEKPSTSSTLEHAVLPRIVDIDRELDGGPFRPGVHHFGNAMTSTFITHLLDTGELEDHIYTTLQPAYARRYYSMMEAIERHLLPLGVTLPQSDRTVVGGYFLWIALPEPLLADDVARRAKEEEELTVGQGSLFAVFGDERTVDLRRQIRVCFSWEEEGNLSRGIERLAVVIRRMLAGSAARSGNSS